MSEGHFISNLTSGSDPDEIVEWADSVTDKLNGEMSFGDPTHPGGSAIFPNGLRGNMATSYVVQTWDTAGAAVVCTHNLGLSIDGIGAPISTPNVNWIANLKHSGVGAGAASPMSLDYQLADAITADSITLRLRVLTRTVNVANPVTACILFWGGTGW